MDTSYRITMMSDAGGEQVAQLTIRSEINIMVTRSDLPVLEGLRLENFGFREAINTIRQIALNDGISLPENQRKYFEIPFRSLDQIGDRSISGRDLDSIEGEFRDRIFIYLEGSCPNTSIVVQRASRRFSIPVTDSNLPGLIQKWQDIQLDPAVSGPTKEVIGLAIAAASLALQAWSEFRDWLRDREEEKRREQEQKEKEGNRCGEHTDASGGPAHDDAMERIGSIA